MKDETCTLVGSSRRIRDIITTSSRSVNQPLGLNRALDCVGEGNIMKNVATPITRVIKPLPHQSAL